MPETVRIQLAAPADARLVIRLLERLARESDTVVIDPNLPKLTVAAERRQLALINQTRGNVILLAKRNRRGLGIVTVQRVSKTAGELGVAIVKKYWRQGLATVLLREAVRWFRTFSSLRALVLTVERRNRVALRLYLKFGFRIVGTGYRKNSHGRSVSIIKMKLT